MSLRWNGVLYKLVEELVGIKHIPRAGVVNLKVKMRCRGMAGITAKGYELSCADRYVERRQTGIGLTGLMLVLIAAQGSFDTW
jgi:hypothetical protein